ncbi:MAG: polyprenyl synthetase family protein [Pseudomonadota bacterium]
MSNLKNRILFQASRDLAEIEEELKKGLNPYLDLVSKVGNYILFSGGKRVRPLLMVLSAKLCGGFCNNHKALSVMFEYLHAATLLHDDVVDEAQVRRGKAVSHTIWGSATTVLVGDFLLAKTMSTAAASGNLQVVEIISNTTAQMSEGEIYQLLNKRKLNLEEPEYLEIIRRKTACLMEAACSIGAIVAGAHIERQTALASYGNNIGIAFQIRDDLLDYTADSGTLGKEAGSDLREGIITLPLIYALKNAEGHAKSRMEEIVRGGADSDSMMEEMFSYINRYGGIEYAQARANHYAATAKNDLAIFDDSETKSLMVDLADYTVTRGH